MSESRDDPKVTSLGDRHDPALSALYRQVPREEPPDTLDARVLAAARSAAEQPVRRLRPRWLPVAGGLAASLLVAVLVVQLLPHSQEPSAISAKKESVAAPARQRALEPVPPPRTMADAVAPAPAAPAESKPIAPEAGPVAQSADEPARETGNAGRSDLRATVPLMEQHTLERTTAAGTAGSLESDRAPKSMPPGDDAFQEIVRLWETGEKDVATERYRAFRKQYPDFTPRARDRAVMEELDQRIAPAAVPQ